jgi:hypothetical protein
MLALVLLALAAAPAAEETAAPVARVMLVGTFHFDDPGLDTVKVKSLDVMQAEPQAYLESLTQRIAREFRPTKVLLEYNPENETVMNERYDQYVAGDFELPENEVYQLGFRIARLAGLRGVESFDHRQIPWKAEPMLDYAQEHDPQAFADFQAEIAKITARMQQERQTLSLAELLKQHNSPEDFALNKSLYIDTNEIGAGDGWYGADAAASWWHRNFRMYGLIQKAAKPGERVLVIGGSGHVAILADLLELDAEREAADVRPLL